LVLKDLTRLLFPVENFFYIQTAADTLVHKPDPRVFEPTLKKLQTENVDRSEVLYVGDGLRDFLAARDAGLRFVGITHGTTSKAAFTEAGADAVDTLTEVITFIN
jgi:phosphoglycolate phosphatase-like HAD superfamily hydrolase